MSMYNTGQTKMKMFHYLHLYLCVNQFRWIISSKSPVGIETTSKPYTHIIRTVFFNWGETYKKWPKTSTNTKNK